MANELEDTAFLAEKAGIIRVLSTRIVQDAIEIGKHLSEVRDRLKHNKAGGFEGWVEAEFKWSKHTAYRLISAYDNEPTVAALAQLHPQLTFMSVLSLAKEPEEVREEVLEQAQEHRFTEKQVLEEIARIRKEASDAALEADIKVSGIRKEYNEITGKLETRIEDLIHENVSLRNTIKGKGKPDFRIQLDVVINQITSFIQNDTLAKALLDLEVIKEKLESEHDIAALERLIQALSSLSERAVDWVKRVMPSNDRWEFRNKGE